MNKQQLYDLIDDPAELNENTLSGLQELIARYPFFQAGRMLLLKNLYVIDHVLFESELKRSALFVSDRTRLFDLIHDAYPERIVKEEEKEADVVEKEVEEAGEEKPSSVAVTGRVESVGDYFGVDEVTETMQGSKVGFVFHSGDDSLSVPEELLFDYEKSDNAGYSLSLYEESSEEEGSYTFEDWLSFVNDNKVGQHAKQEDKTEDKKSNTLDVIDKFLSTQDKTIKPQSRDTERRDEKIEESTMFDEDELMTETLAKIYMKQGHYSKALNIFEKLSLKYPEKSVYFAQQIEKVKKLISNQ